MEVPFCALTVEPHIKRKAIATKRPEHGRALIAGEKTRVQDSSEVRKTDADRLRLMLVSLIFVEDI
jgi:hypothetical protein